MRKIHQQVWAKAGAGQGFLHATQLPCRQFQHHRLRRLGSIRSDRDIGHGHEQAGFSLGRGAVKNGFHAQRHARTVAGRRQPAAVWRQKFLAQLQLWRGRGGHRRGGGHECNDR